MRERCRSSTAPFPRFACLPSPLPGKRTQHTSSPTPPSSAKRKSLKARQNSFSSPSSPREMFSSSSSSPVSACSPSSVLERKRSRRDTSPSASSSSSSHLRPKSKIIKSAVECFTDDSNATCLPCKGKRADGASCQRKAKSDCAFGCCLNCCRKRCDESAIDSMAAVSPFSACPVHAKLHQQRKEEEALLAQPITAQTSENRWGGKESRMRVEDGLYKESSIEWVGDTVVIFSLRDFLRSSKWCKDALEQGLRRRRMRRSAGAEGKEGGRKMETGGGVEARRTRFEGKIKQLILKAGLDI